MNAFNGEFVSHAPEEESYLFFAESQVYDYYCRIRRSELEKLAIKYIMGNRVEKVVLNLPTTVSKGSPAWTRGQAVYHQVVVGKYTFIFTTSINAATTGTYNMPWHVRIVHD